MKCKHLVHFCYFRQLFKRSTNFVKIDNNYDLWQIQHTYKGQHVFMHFLVYIILTALCKHETKCLYFVITQLSVNYTEPIILTTYSSFLKKFLTP